MWPFLSRALFPPPTEAWLQRASSDPEAQGWGAWSPAEKTHLGPGAGREEEETGEAEEDDEEDAGFLLSLLEREGLAECPVPDQVTTEQNAWGKPVGSWELGEPGAWGQGIDRCSSASRGQRATVPCLEEGIGTPATHKLERPLCVGVYKRGFLHAHVLTASLAPPGSPQNNLRTGRPIPSVLAPGKPRGRPTSRLSLGHVLAGAGGHQTEAVGHGAGPGAGAAQGAGPG